MLIALPAGAALAGIIGLFAAIPVVAFALAIAGALVSVLGVGPEHAGDHRATRWCRSGSTDSASGAGVCSSRSACSASSSPRSSQVPIVVIPLVLGVVLAATLAPLADGLERRGWSHDRAAIGATLGAAVGIIVIVGLTVVSLAPPVTDMIDSAVAGSSSADSSTGGQAGILVTLVQTFGTGVLVTIAGVLSTLAGIAVILLLATLLTFYFMRDGGAFWQAFLGRVEPGRRSHVGGGRQAGVRRARRLHDRDRRHLGLRGGDPVPDHGHPGHPARRCRWPSCRSSAGSSRTSGASSRPALAFLVTIAVGDAAGHRDHGHLDDRVQHRPGQHHRAARLRQGRQPPPGHRPGGDPGRQRSWRASSGCSWPCRSSASSRPVWRTVLQVLVTDRRAERRDGRRPPPTRRASRPGRRTARRRTERLTRPRRTWNGAGRVPAEARPDPRRRESVAPATRRRVRSRGPSPWPTANSSSVRMPWAWSSASFWSCAICGSSAGAGRGPAGAYSCGGAAAAAAVAACCVLLFAYFCC